MTRKTNIAEIELVELLKSKSHRGYSILYENYSKTLYDILYKVVQSKDTATDLLQDSFDKFGIILINIMQKKGAYILGW